MDLSFYQNKTVLVTGHTGFKGAWMCQVLKLQGAKVIGYALEPPTEPSLFYLAKVSEGMTSIIGDIRSFRHLNETIAVHQPEIVIHMAAQPIVRESYEKPVYTYDVNIMGTVSLLEAVRQHACVRSVVNVTTDKVYRNNEWAWGYREDDVLDGYDPYSNSKSCSELVTNSYRNCFFRQREIAVSTCRAGNVIGGGDFARDRIIPDCVRAQQLGEEIIIRNPYSTRPYQHVLEPVCAYLKLAELQYLDAVRYEGSYNVGPDDCDCVSTGSLAELFCQLWGDGATWRDESEENAPHEAGLLKLDCSKIKQAMGWKPRWNIQKAVAETVAWSRMYLAGGDYTAEMKKQILRYLKQEKA